MESHISHYMAAYLASRPKANSKKLYINILNYKKQKNGLDIKTLYLKTYNIEDEEYTLTEKELNFSMFKKSSSSNIPIIKSRINNSIYRALYSLSH